MGLVLFGLMKICIGLVSIAPDLWIMIIGAVTMLVVDAVALSLSLKTFRNQGLVGGYFWWD